MDTTRPATDNFFIRHATKIAIGTVTLLMLLAAGIFWRQNEAKKQANDWVTHTYEVRGHIRLLLRAGKDS